jgi:hypothetical protein
LNQNNSPIQNPSSAEPVSRSPHEAAARENETYRGPDTVVIDLGQAIRDFEKNIRYVRSPVNLEANEVLRHLTNEIEYKDYDRDSLLDFIADVRHHLEDGMRPNEMECLADALEKLGMALVSRLRTHNIFNPVNERFEYYFHGIANDSMAVFRRRSRASNDEN